MVRITIYIIYNLQDSESLSSNTGYTATLPTLNRHGHTGTGSQAEKLRHRHTAGEAKTRSQGGRGQRGKSQRD